MTVASPTAEEASSEPLTFAQAGRGLIAERFAAMWAERHGVLGGDVDAVHDMRVASRRLRAALDVFAPAFPGGAYQRLHRMTARLTDELGAVRDHDVMLETLRREHGKVEQREIAGLDGLIAVIAAERAAAGQGLAAFFDEIEEAGYARRMDALFGVVAKQEHAHG